MVPVSNRTSNWCFELGLDINDDANPDATFSIPDSLTGYVGLYAVNDDQNSIPLCYLEDGTTVQMNAN